MSISRGPELELATDGVCSGLVAVCVLCCIGKNATEHLNPEECFSEAIWSKFPPIMAPQKSEKP